MNYSKKDAKAYSRAHFKGVWAAIQTPMHADLSVNEAGLRENFAHWIEELHIDGFFVGGKQAEFFSMSVQERKRSFEIAVQAVRANKLVGGASGQAQAGVITSCSDTNLDVVLELARYSQQIGADYIVVHSPVLHFGADTDDTIFEYYRYLSEQLQIGIALWNHPDCGYIMSPQLCARIAQLENIVAIKYSVPREQYAQLTKLAGDQILVSTASEEEWLDNVIELGWQLYLCSNPPFLLQTAAEQKICAYTKLAFAGKQAEARALSASLNGARHALKQSRPKGKPQAHAKYWQELLGQSGGPVRRPLLPLTQEDKQNIKQAFLTSRLVN